MLAPEYVSGAEFRILRASKGAPKSIDGYGLVVGLDGSGDQTTQTPFTVQSIITMQQMGVTIPVGNEFAVENVAAVDGQTFFAPCSQPGQTLDVTFVSSWGECEKFARWHTVYDP